MKKGKMRKTNSIVSDYKLITDMNLNCNSQNEDEDPLALRVKQLLAETDYVTRENPPMFTDTSEDEGILYSKDLSICQTKSKKDSATQIKFEVRSQRTQTNACHIMFIKQLDSKQVGAYADHILASCLSSSNINFVPEENIRPSTSVNELPWPDQHETEKLQSPIRKYNDIYKVDQNGKSNIYERQIILEGLEIIALGRKLFSLLIAESTNENKDIPRKNSYLSLELNKNILPPFLDMALKYEPTFSKRLHVNCASAKRAKRELIRKIERYKGFILITKVYNIKRYCRIHSGKLYERTKPKAHKIFLARGLRQNKRHISSSSCSQIPLEYIKQELRNLSLALKAQRTSYVKGLVRVCEKVNKLYNRQEVPINFSSEDPRHKTLLNIYNVTNALLPAADSKFVRQHSAFDVDTNEDPDRRISLGTDLNIVKLNCIQPSKTKPDKGNKSILKSDRIDLYSEERERTLKQEICFRNYAERYGGYLPVPLDDLGASDSHSNNFSSSNGSSFPSNENPFSEDLYTDTNVNVAAPNALTFGMKYIDYPQVLFHPRSFESARPQQESIASISQSIKRPSKHSIPKKSLDNVSSFENIKKQPQSIDLNCRQRSCQSIFSEAESSEKYLELPSEISSPLPRSCEDTFKYPISWNIEPSICYKKVPSTTSLQDSFRQNCKGLMTRMDERYKLVKAYKGLKTPDQQSSKESVNMDRNHRKYSKVCSDTVFRNPTEKNLVQTNKRKNREHPQRPKNSTIKYRTKRMQDDRKLQISRKEELLKNKLSQYIFSKKVQYCTLDGQLHLGRSPIKW